MGERFKRNLTGRDALEPGEYFSDVLACAMGQMCTVWLRCKSCGTIDALPPTHVVQRGGKTVPAWKCPCATCCWFDFIELEGFGEPVR